jgi:hypothetical protein
MYICRKENQSNGTSIGSNLFGNMFFHKKDPECDESEIISNSLSRQKSDETIDTNHVYPMKCTANDTSTRAKEINIELPGCNVAPLPPKSDTNMKDIDVEDGRCGVLPSSVPVSSCFKISGTSPLRTPKVFKKRQQSKFRDEKKLGNSHNKRDRSSSVYVRGNTPLRSISRQKQVSSYSLADDMLDESDHITHVESPVSFYAAAKKGRLSSDRLYSKDISKQVNPKKSAEDDISSIEQKKCKIDVDGLHEDRAFRRQEIITIDSDGSSTIEWDNISSVVPQGSSFDDNLREFDDMIVEMETDGIEVSKRCDSDDID